MTYNDLINNHHNEESQYKKNELLIVYQFLKENVVTASMLEQFTGIHQKSICRYKRTLEKSGMLFEIERKRCKVTGKTAWYLTTNEELIPPTNQLKLF